MTRDELLFMLATRVVAYRPQLAAVSGGALGALLMSVCVVLQSATKRADGLFECSVTRLRKLTGMTRREFEGARETLMRRGLVEKKRTGVPARNFYAVDLDELSRVIAPVVSVCTAKEAKKGSEPTGNTEKTAAETRIKQVCTEIDGGSAGKVAGIIGGLVQDEANKQVCTEIDGGFGTQERGIAGAFPSDHSVQTIIGKNKKRARTRERESLFPESMTSRGRHSAVAWLERLEEELTHRAKSPFQTSPLENFEGLRQRYGLRLVRLEKKDPKTFVDAVNRMIDGVGGWVVRDPVGWLQNKMGIMQTRNGSEKTTGGVYRDLSGVEE